MWHGRVKFGIGLWLILSGFIPILRHPLNLLIVGFIGALCCFSSYRIWQAAATGLVGLWLFLIGLRFWVVESFSAAIHPAYFISGGVLMAVLGGWCLASHSRELSEKGFIEAG